MFGELQQDWRVDGDRLSYLDWLLGMRLLFCSLNAWAGGAPVVAMCCCAVLLHVQPHNARHVALHSRTRAGLQHVALQQSPGSTLSSHVSAATAALYSFDGTHLGLSLFAVCVCVALDSSCLLLAGSGLYQHLRACFDI
jgi:hypothetical protein